MTNTFTYNLFASLCILFIGLSCSQKQDNQPAEGDVLLAQVHKKKLFASNLSDMVPQRSSPEDSALIMNAYIDRWVRDNVMMHEAEKNIPKDLNIDELVRDYRASLVKHNYEKLIVELQLDSVVTQQELNQYYSENKEHYLLESTIVRCHFIKVPLLAEGLDELENLWNNRTEENYKAMIDYCRNNAEVYMLEDSSWYKTDDFSFQFPQGTFNENNLNQNTTVNTQDENFQYYFRVLETVPAKQIAPLTYIKEQASKVILHQRKIKLLEQQKEQMYQRELKRNNIKIFNN